MAEIGVIKFELAHMNFCMYADHILEIVRYEGARSVPCPLPYVVGLCELRRHIVTVVDLHTRVGLPAAPRTKDTVMIVTSLPAGTYGMLVDNIYDFRRVPEERILPPISIAGLPEYLLRGVLTDADDILPIPDFEKMFSSFLHIHLVPISLSEKIAFRYRFTPGALTRTLENNLLARQRLDAAMIKKLSRSLYIPSSQVHRMTSYYRDFLPESGRSESQAFRHGGGLRAGDEQYASLSQDMDRQQQRATAEQRRVARPPEASAADLLTALPTDSVSAALEYVLHHQDFAQAEIVLPTDHSQVRRLRLRPAVGRPLAKRLGMAPARLNRYWTYYRAPERAAEEAVTLSPSISDDSVDAILADAQPPEPHEQPVHALLRTLRRLHEESRVLSREMVGRLCADYHVTPVRLARLLSAFPEYSVAVRLTDSPASDEPEDAELQPGTPPTDSTDARHDFPDLAAAEKPVTDILWQLADQRVLGDQRTLRQVAVSRKISTCRLNKLQQYYWSSSKA